MTGRKYEARNDELPTQIAELTSRLARLEALATNRPGVSVGAAIFADFNLPPASTTSGTFQTGYYLYLNGAAQGLEAYFRVTTPAAVTMEVRIVDDPSNVVISPVVVVLASSNTFIGIRARSTDGSNVFTARAELRVASGAGTVRIGLLRAVGGNYQQGTF